jgi:HK97 family phage portal protein
MLKAFRTKLRNLFSGWFPLSSVPSGFFGQTRPGAVESPEQALTISSFWAALRLYQLVIGSLPLVTYRRATSGRMFAANNPVYNLLCYRPNPAQSRAVFFQQMVQNCFLGTGNSYTLIRRTNAGEVLGLYPIKPEHVLRVAVDAEWNKAFLVWTPNGQEVYFDSDVLHLFYFSLDGITGVPLLRFAGESLGLHRQVLESASSYFQNRAKPSGYLKYPGKLNAQAVDEIKKYFKSEYAGADNTGKIPVLADGGEFVQFDESTAADAELLAALGASAEDVGRWFNLSPLALGNLTRGTYSNLGADNAAMYQRSIRPFLNLIELELNWKLFGPDSEYYSEFLTQAILAGDPTQQTAVANVGILNGSVLRSEQREWLNLPPVPGLDRPLYPANQWQLDAAGNVILPDNPNTQPNDPNPAPTA